MLKCYTTMATTPSFIALMNKLGIACAASDDFTIYNLSSKEPLAIAVNPRSKIPWEDVIALYKQLGDPEPQITLSMYAEQMRGFLNGISGLSGSGLKDEKVILLGYGSQEIYPSVYSFSLDAAAEGNIILQEIENVQIGGHIPTTFVTMGDFERISPILYGASPRVCSYYEEKQRSAKSEIVSRLHDLFSGTEYESAAEVTLSAYNSSAYEPFANATGKAKNDVNLGLSSFSISDLVTSAETIINANSRLSHLFAGVRPPLECVSEMAVITRPEGLKWVKHSIFFEN